MSARRLLVLCSLALAALPSSAAAVVEGAPGRIAFTSDRDGNSEIYTAWPDGSEPARLTDDPAADRSPAFSPDASRIAFTTFRDGAEAIYVMNADGSGQTRVSPDLVGTARDSLPAWSPDGTKLAFASTRPFGDGSAIWVMDANGENLRRVTTDFGSHPSWSPDGQQIAYVGRGEAIHVVNADAWDPHRITFGTLPEGDPAWSPSGGQLAIARYPEDWPASNARDLFIVDSRGSWEVQLTSGGSFDANPSWAPDGSRIVLQRHQGAGRLLQGRRRRPGAVLARRRSGLERPDGLGARLARSVLHRRVRGPLGHGDDRDALVPRCAGSLHLRLEDGAGVGGHVPAAGGRAPRQHLPLRERARREVTGELGGAEASSRPCALPHSTIALAADREPLQLVKGRAK